MKKKNNVSYYTMGLILNIYKINFSFHIIAAFLEVWKLAVIGAASAFFVTILLLIIVSFLLRGWVDQITKALYTGYLRITYIFFFKTTSPIQKKEGAIIKA